MNDEMNGRMTSIFSEMSGRLPTIAEVQEFAAHIQLIRQFDEEKQTSVFSRQDEVTTLLGCEVYSVDVDQIYELFNRRIAAMKLDTMIQEVVYWWQADDKFYADFLYQLVEIA